MQRKYIALWRTRVKTGSFVVYIHIHVPALQVLAGEDHLDNQGRAGFRLH